MALPIFVGDEVQSGTGGIVDEALCTYSITVSGSKQNFDIYIYIADLLLLYK